jgi:hypothetical protein
VSMNMNISSKIDYALNDLFIFSFENKIVIMNLNLIISV